MKTKISEPFVLGEKEQKPSAFYPYLILENMVPQTFSTNLENRLLPLKREGNEPQMVFTSYGTPFQTQPCSLHSLIC